MTKLFLDLFKKAGLTEKEKEYFVEDIKNAITCGYTSVNEYYNNKETQYCLTEYANEEYKEIAKSGLEKILKVINTNEEVETIKQWFKENYTCDNEEYNSSIVNYLNNNIFRLEIPMTGEIKEMRIPVNHFEEFKELHKKLISACDSMDTILNNMPEFTWQDDEEEYLKNNEEYQELNVQYDDIQERIYKLIHLCNCPLCYK